MKASKLLSSILLFEQRFDLNFKISEIHITVIDIRVRHIILLQFYITPSLTKLVIVTLKSLLNKLLSAKSCCLHNGLLVG